MATTEPTTRPADDQPPATSSPLTAADLETLLADGWEFDIDPSEG